MYNNRSGHPGRPVVMLEPEAVPEAQSMPASKPLRMRKAVPPRILGQARVASSLWKGPSLMFRRRPPWWFRFWWWLALLLSALVCISD